ncbi:hypothetical protein CEXT_288991 [Caerostris extrusa]|uniref:Uncharacterized protein n=1 Tax=Caerostris extrusa TaxID=172846 RepID=A0AAV4XY97_CAEEX|nr:hypothetical protein CEXT_288991 [Caerostris extrusa]
MGSHSSGGLPFAVFQGPPSLHFGGRQMVSFPPHNKGVIHQSPTKECPDSLTFMLWQAEKSSFALAAGILASD